MQLLTGKLMNFEAMHALVPLSKDDFKDANYERAVVEPVTQAAKMAEFGEGVDDDEIACIVTTTREGLASRQPVTNTSENESDAVSIGGCKLVSTRPASSIISL